VNTVIYYISPNPPPTTTTQKIYLYKYFFIRTTYVEFQTATTITPQGNLTSDREISSIYNNAKIKETVQEVRFPMSYHN
jgi:hypothetical protein